MKNIIRKAMNLYTTILKHKFIAVCILFTVFTLLDTIPILLGLWPAKDGLGPYIHLMGRFILHSLLIIGLSIYDALCKKVKSKLAIYILTYLITWGLLLIYVWSNSIFTTLHPDAFIDVSISYTFMYILFGIVIYIINRGKNPMK